MPRRCWFLAVTLLPGVALPCGAAEGEAAAAPTGPRLELLWERQVDPRWKPGDGQENGISAEFVEFSADGTLLVTGNGQGEAFVLETADGSVARTFTVYRPADIAGRREFNISGGRAKAMEVECGYFSPDGKLVALAGNFGGVQVFRLSDGKRVTELDAEGAEVDGMAMAPDGRYFAHASRHAVRVRRAGSWEVVHRVPQGRGGAVNSIDFTPDGAYMASAGGHGRVVINRTDDWKEVGRCLIEGTSSIKSTRFSPDGRRVAAGYGGAKCVAVFRASDASLVVKRPLFYIEAVAWTPRGDYLLAGGRDGRGHLHVFETAHWKKVATVEVQKDRCNVEYIDTHRDLVAVCGEDGHVRVFRLAAPRTAPPAGAGR